NCRNGAGTRHPEERAERTLVLVVVCSTLPLDRYYHPPAHAEGPVLRRSSKRILSNNVDAACGKDESSTTNLSIASTSCGTFQTSAQKSSTILTESICPLFYCTAIHSARPRQPPATDSAEQVRDSARADEKSFLISSEKRRKGTGSRNRLRRS